jgi:hypothetical protein
MTNSEIEKHVSEILREYRLNRKGTPAAFIRQYRKFSAVPGLPKIKALEMAQKFFPEEYRQYVLAQNRGDQLPPLDGHRPGYKTRLEAAIRRGGVIG